MAFLDVLNNIIFPLTVPVDFLFENLVLLLTTTFGFLLAISILGYSEYLVVKDIAKSPDIVKLKIFFSRIKKYKAKNSGARADKVYIIYKVDAKDSRKFYYVAT